MFGGELRDNDDWTLSLLTNKEVLHLHRYGKGGRQVALNEEHAIWTSEDEQGNHYVALFNLSDETLTLKVSFEQLNVSIPNTIRDLWQSRDLEVVNEGISQTLPQHGSVLLKFK
ncbi:hypothetical protein D3C81_1710620 [compost metagenome]